MTFHAVATETETTYFIDGFEVPQAVYDTFRPSKLFPVDTGMSLAEAEEYLAAIKACAEPREENRGPCFALAISGDKPIRSDALAVHPKQIKQVLARNKRHGLSIPYDREGRPVFTDPNQRKKLCKIEGVRDMNSYYGY